LTIECNAPGILEWKEKKPCGDICMMGFGVYDSNTAFLIGMNPHPLPGRNSVTYIILKIPPSSLRKHEAHLFGLTAGTMPEGPPNTVAVAKRTVLVDPSNWDAWGGSDNCPEPVKSWLLVEGQGIFANLESESESESDSDGD
jgi:hypothetical protein